MIDLNKLAFWRKPSHVIENNSRVGLGKRLGTTDLRRGMWVVYEGRVGIATSLADIGGVPHVGVDLVSGSGETEISATVPVSSVIQARHDDIPACRRPGKSAAARLGYLS